MKLKTLSAILALSSGALFAQTVEVQGAWARATVPGQKATGAFMKITAKEGTKLVSVSSPVAGVAEVHEMKMDGDVMKMRAVAGGLDLPAGNAVQVKPGAHGGQVTDLIEPVAHVTSIAVTLVFKDAKGVETRTELTVPVAMAAPGAKPADMPAMDHSKHKM